MLFSRGGTTKVSTSIDGGTRSRELNLRSRTVAPGSRSRQPREKEQGREQRGLYDVEDHPRPDVPHPRLRAAGRFRVRPGNVRVLQLPLEVVTKEFLAVQHPHRGEAEDQSADG